MHLVLLLTLASVHSVDRSKFKSCDQSGFCKRGRAVQPGPSSYEVEAATLHTSAGGVRAARAGKSCGVRFVGLMTSCAMM